MFKLAQIAQDYREAASLCSQINLFGFVDDQTFLTKSGDLGVVFSLSGIDYECLDTANIDHITQRLTAAFRTFDEKCRVYQYLFKRNRAAIPYQSHSNPIVNTAIQNRIAHLKSKADSLYSFEIYYVVLYEAFRYKSSLIQSFS